MKGLEQAIFMQIPRCMSVDGKNTWENETEMPFVYASNGSEQKTFLKASLVCLTYDQVFHSVNWRAVVNLSLISSNYLFHFAKTSFDS